jgi:hypothetical protein
LVIFSFARLPGSILEAFEVSDKIVFDEDPQFPRFRRGYLPRPCPALDRVRVQMEKLGRFLQV